MAGGAKTLILPNAQKSGLRPACHLLGPLHVVCWRSTEKTRRSNRQVVCSSTHKPRRSRHGGEFRGGAICCPARADEPPRIPYRGRRDRINKEKALQIQ